MISKALIPGQRPAADAQSLNFDREHYTACSDVHRSRSYGSRKREKEGHLPMKHYKLFKGVMSISWPVAGRNPRRRRYLSELSRSPKITAQGSGDKVQCHGYAAAGYILMGGPPSVSYDAQRPSPGALSQTARIVRSDDDFRSPRLGRRPGAESQGPRMSRVRAVVSDVVERVYIRPHLQDGWSALPDSILTSTPTFASCPRFHPQTLIYILITSWPPQQK